MDYYGDIKPTMEYRMFGWTILCHILVRIVLLIWHYLIPLKENRNQDKIKKIKENK